MRKDMLLRKPASSYRVAPPTVSGFVTRRRKGEHGFAWIGALAFAAMLAACGGSDAPTTTIPPMSASPIGADAAQSITLAEPTNVFGTNRIALSWSAHGSALTFSVLLKRSERDEFDVVAQGIDTQSTEIRRGAAWRYDFPTARVKVRGCTPGNDCFDSNEQPLLSALLGGVIALDPSPDSLTNSAFGSRLALDGIGDTLAVTDVLDARPGTPPLLDQFGSFYIFQRDAAGLWQRELYQLGPNAATLFGNRVTLARDGNLLAVAAQNASPAGAPPGVFDPRGAVFVYAHDAGTWHQQAVLQVLVDADCNDVRHFGADMAMSGNGTRLAIASDRDVF